MDETKGVLFAGTGSAAYDFYGGNRKGSNLFANCLLALDANTGKRKWHFQFIHHDVWDKDLPTPPVLSTIERGGKAIDVVIQTTKNGQIFIFERETGKPFFPIVETKVPTDSDLEGEKPWPIYRIHEAEQYAVNQWVLGVEGEKSVEAARFLGICTVTWMGSAWSDVDLESGLISLKKAGNLERKI